MPLKSVPRYPMYSSRTCAKVVHYHVLLLRHTMSDRNKKAIFFILFIVLGILALQVPLTHLVGSKASFTLFDAFGPIAGAFLGSIPGVLSVLSMQIVNVIWHGASFSDMGAVIRLLPVAVAALYFSRKMPLNVVIPALAIISFVSNPVGREVWYFSLFWTIPIICYFFQERFLLARALGATMTAHSVGGALWIWLVPLPPAVCVGLIPPGITERLLFTFGIALTYLAFNNAFSFLNAKLPVGWKLPVSERYVWIHAGVK